MKYLKDFFSLYFLYLLTGVFLLFYFPKGDLELLLNQIHSPFLDTFFYYWTYLGDGILIGVVFIALLFVGYNHAIGLIILTLIQTVFVQLFKRHLFGGMPRPKLFFEGKDVQLHFVDGLVVHSIHSFPSGHTATAFALATLLSYLSKGNRLFMTIYFFAAVLVGISRMYLLQHFFIDTFFGSLFGVASAIAAIKIIEYYRIRTEKRWFLEGALLRKI
jgi:membrane-associated phospholipid phosphatase